MGLQNDPERPTLIYDTCNNADDIAIHQIRNQMTILNKDLRDSGFGHYQYDLRLDGQKAYIEMMQ